MAGRFETNLQAKVLILTYWNVNYPIICSSSIAHFVLILTYWNVNYFQKLQQLMKYSVLILTYWNVNIYKMTDKNGKNMF